MLYAKRRRHNLLFIPPNREKYGQQTTRYHCEELTDKADCMIAFWDGVSWDVSMLIDAMKRKGKPVRIVEYTRKAVVAALK